MPEISGILPELF